MFRVRRWACGKFQVGARFVDGCVRFVPGSRSVTWESAGHSRCENKSFFHTRCFSKTTTLGQTPVNNALASRALDEILSICAIFMVTISQEQDCVLKIWVEVNIRFFHNSETALHMNAAFFIGLFYEPLGMIMWGFSLLTGSRMDIWEFARLVGGWACMWEGDK